MVEDIPEVNGELKTIHETSVHVVGTTFSFGGGLEVVETYSKLVARSLATLAKKPCRGLHALGPIWAFRWLGEEVQQLHAEVHLTGAQTPAGLVETHMSK